MNVIIAGYGKMGRLIESRALEKGHSIAAVIDPFSKEEKSTSGVPISGSLPLAAASCSPVPVIIDFTHPAVVLGNIRSYTEAGFPAVIGTTGWYDRLGEVEALVRQGKTRLLYAPNFSLGVSLFYRIAAYAAALLDPFPDYDAGGFEVHHNRKADSPSGTAKTLAQEVLAVMTRKKRAVYDKLDRPPEPDELHIASVRVGGEPGTHSLVFDSPADTIEITHRARNREGLAAGAVSAAEWLAAKKESGIFTLEDILR